MEQHEKFRQKQEEEEEEEEEEIWSWGAGTEGQLATGKLQDELRPQLLHSLPSFGPISFLSCGAAHAAALTPDGRALTWGRGTSGQLGHGELANSLRLKLVESLKGFVITHVSAGWNHSGFVSDTGCLFTCGDGSFGQLGHGDFTSQSSPAKVLSFDSRHVVQIACGMRHSLALLKGHQVYGFGSGKRGQLGISNDKVKSVCLPQITVGLEDVKIVSIIANGDHSAALCASGHLYTWGRGFSGTSDVYSPLCITRSLLFSQASLGWNHALALTCDNQVFMVGGYHHGVLSNPQSMTRTKHSCENEEAKEGMVQRVLGLDQLKVRQIAAGAEHSALVTDDGSVMTWGWGEHGQLGLGDTVDQTVPQVVHLGRHAENRTVSRVFCGSGFTFTIKTVLAHSQAFVQPK